ncbi:MAG: hypothetical protein H7257_01680, partial [Taibaiella sp.]|nr:hypothetical protein [Taibaiella sp.]
MNSFVDLSDTCEGSESDEMVEAKQFWQQRVTANDSSGFNMFSKYYFALRAAVLAGRGTCGTGGYQGKWECIGPDSLPVQTAGYVTCVWADPDDTGSNYVLAGTYGGLFKSTNGGKNWDCITDNAPLIGGVFGITSIAVNPLNKNTIYLATGGVGLLHDAGAGILVSHDGGNTWAQELMYTSHYWDSIQRIDKIFITPDSTRLYVFSYDNIYTRYNVGTGNTWVEITPPGNKVNCTWRNLQFQPGNQNHFFVSNRKGDNKAFTGIYESSASVPSASDWDEITASFST